MNLRLKTIIWITVKNVKFLIHSLVFAEFSRSYISSRHLNLKEYLFNNLDISSSIVFYISQWKKAQALYKTLFKADLIAERKRQINLTNVKMVLIDLVSTIIQLFLILFLTKVRTTFSFLIRHLLQFHPFFFFLVFSRKATRIWSQPSGKNFPLFE